MFIPYGSKCKGGRTMTIKEVEERLGLPRATIRFYEKEQLIVPQRSGNSYREYSEDDIAVLKKIIILRKLGFSVSEIKNFLEENVPLQELLEKNISELQEKMNELNGAIKICKKMQSRQENFDTFNENFYWEEIHNQELAGNKFLEIVNDAVDFEKKLLIDYFAIKDILQDKRSAFLKVLGIFFASGGVYLVLNGLQGDWSIKSFLRGVSQPFITIIILTMFLLPLHFLEKKYSDLANKLLTTGWCIAAGGLLVLIFWVLLQ